MSKYFKPDCELGYIEDSADIAYQKFSNARQTVLACMLGDFDENGSYFVSPDLVAELIDMPKYLVETLDNIEICKSALKLDKQISFMVTFEQDRATLSLVEKMSYEANLTLNSGTYSNINEYVLDSVQTSGLINKNSIYNRWNINPFGGVALDIFSCDEVLLEKYFNIVSKFKTRLKENTILLENEEKLEEIEAGYTVSIFEVLSRYPKLENVVVNQFKKKMEQKKDFIKPNKPHFVQTLNEILDKAIEDNRSVLSAEELQEFNAEMHNVKIDAVNKRQAIIPMQQTVMADEKNAVTSNDLSEENVHRSGAGVVTFSDAVTNESHLTVADNYVTALNDVLKRVNGRAVDKAVTTTLEGKGISVVVPDSKKGTTAESASKDSLIKRVTSANQKVSATPVPKQAETLNKNETEKGAETTKKTETDTEPHKSSTNADTDYSTSKPITPTNETRKVTNTPAKQNGTVKENGRLMIDAEVVDVAFVSDGETVVESITK